MKLWISIVFVALVTLVQGQALRDINFNYLYNPGESFSFELKPVHQGKQWTILYRLHIRDTTLKTSDFSVQWESRQSLIEKHSNGFDSTFSIKEQGRTKFEFYGLVTLPSENAPKILVAKVLNIPAKRAWIFYRTLEENYPVNCYWMLNGQFVLVPFINPSNSISVKGVGSKIVSYYNDEFPAALPPFSETQGRVQKRMKTDTTFLAEENSELNFSQRGLYLIQSDTNSASGLALRVEDDYPKFTKVASLAGPLIYICTKIENDRLILAKNDKKAFDRVILSITSDTDRARKLIRNYFRRVELANQFFTSYKEGWKTDRGMIFIIFGLPDEVFKFNDREVWTYSNDVYKATFDFVKSSSIFDPENYVLIRDKKFQQTWYEVIDLWRNARL